MADIPAWLKNFRNPVIHAITSIEQESCFEGANNNKDNKFRPSTVGRGSSYLKFGRRKTPSISASYSPPHFTSAEEVWHNPDDIQVFETLRVILMTRSAFEPVPVQYNSCILQILEAYENMQGTMRQKDQNFEAVEARLVKLTEEFQHQRLLWDTKENDYRKEIKKLEVTLATGERGLDLVTMARTKSVVYKSTADSRGDISNYEDGSSTQNCGQPGLSHLAAKIEKLPLTPQVSLERMTVDYATERDRHTSEKFATRMHGNRDSFILGKQHEQFRQFGALFNPVSANDTAEMAYTAHGIRASDTGDSGHQKLRESAGISSKSSPSEGDLGAVGAAAESFSDVEDSQRSTIIGAKHQNKPLPKLPSNTAESISKEREIYDEDAQQQKTEKSEAQPGSRKRGFSFVPGCEILPMESTRRGCMYELSIISPEDSHVRNGTAPQKTTSQKVRRLKNNHSSASIRPSDLTTSLTPFKAVDAISSMERSHPSPSSVVTAKRENSGWSNNGQLTRQIVQPEVGWPKSDRYNGRNEATIAAVRAIIGNESRTS